MRNCISVLLWSALAHQLTIKLTNSQTPSASALVGVCFWEIKEEAEFCVWVSTMRTGARIHGTTWSERQSDLAELGCCSVLDSLLELRVLQWTKWESPWSREVYVKTLNITGMPSSKKENIVGKDDGVMRYMMAEENLFEDKMPMQRRERNERWVVGYLGYEADRHREQERRPRDGGHLARLGTGRTTASLEQCELREQWKGWGQPGGKGLIM